MKALVTLVAAVLLAGCNIVYKQNIQQGNALDEDALEQLENGMTKRQVLVLLGSPAVQSPFHEDRWDYVNSFARRGGDAERLSLTIQFENDRVVDYHGSFLEQSTIAGTAIDELEIIDPNSNQPVLPRRRDDEEPLDDPVDVPIEDPVGSPLPDTDDPAGG